MRHLTALGDPGLPEHAFKADPMGRIQPNGGGGGKSPPEPPPPAPPAPPPAEAKTPDAAEMINTKKTKATQAPALQETMLTGPNGVDQNSLDLNKKTLLGG